MHHPGWRNSMFTKLLKSFNVWALTLLRIVAAFVFWEHGLQK
jgi:uncharacterized membrane protein YphA (DoxX/SURF4 family)